jgi:hypothetical protein
MELIKKRFLRARKIAYSSTGNTKQGYYIPDTGTSYNVKFLLTKNVEDFGFFDTLDDPKATGATGVPISSVEYTVTGNSPSRLSELRKWSPLSGLSKQYYTSTGVTENGLDLNKTTITEQNKTYWYYIDGITYRDIIVGNNSRTEFSFKSKAYKDSNNFTNLPYIKDESKQNVIDEPIVNNDVFIVREELPVFENNYRLRDIENLTALTFYGGGNYFNVVNNT